MKLTAKNIKEFKRILKEEDNPFEKISVLDLVMVCDFALTRHEQATAALSDMKNGKKFIDSACGTTAGEDEASNILRKAIAKLEENLK